MSIQAVKQRFEIIGNDSKLNLALEKAIRVAPTDISVLVTGESGVGKESIPRIIHSLSHRKHAKYIAVNCGAIPEGTIDSELFGHEKGAFTGANTARSGYFETADGGTIFLDEVGELPLSTQVRLLRILENGEFMKVGSSQILKTDVRIIAATNIDMNEAIKSGRFREDLYYRLSTVDINLPPLRERKDDIHLLFRKFASDFAHKYKMPTVRLDDSAVDLLVNYRWSGNIRQLRNVAEQISVLEQDREIDAVTLQHYLPEMSSYLPALVKTSKSKSDFSSEREILYKVLFDMQRDINDLKSLTLELLKSGDIDNVEKEHSGLIEQIYENFDAKPQGETTVKPNIELLDVPTSQEKQQVSYDYAEEVEEEESLSLQEKELELIKRSLKKHDGRRKAAAEELGISERTLYRKIKQYDL
ncbi:MAG TPA: sigma-54 dependent transcriptional regulator [Flavobacteriaceae bacterium]|nr:sigma-54 dependent transcriptional regulator [Flavobacteriaceae bacterium]